MADPLETMIDCGPGAIVACWKEKSRDVGCTLSTGASVTFNVTVTVAGA
jgi:hypothetical protein